MFKDLADSEAPTSLANQYRNKRFELFRRLMSQLDKPIRILDVGGTQQFWVIMGFTATQGMPITILNVTKQPVSLPHFSSMAGDAKDLTQFEDRHFDVVFSNSVIEHVGGYEDQRRMAEEIKRVGKRYFIQTPNRYFPIEPHFLFPGFQFLPFAVRVWLISHFNLGWYKRTPDRAAAEGIANEIKLLSKTEFANLFPQATIFEERMMGLTKSFIAYNGWNNRS